MRGNVPDLFFALHRILNNRWQYIIFCDTLESCINGAKKPLRAFFFVLKKIWRLEKIQDPYALVFVRPKLLVVQAVQIWAGVGEWGTDAAVSLKASKQARPSFLRSFVRHGGQTPQHSLA